VSKFRERAGTGTTRLARNPTMSSEEVAKLGYAGWQANRRVVITGARNAILARLVPFLPRRTLLGIVHNMQVRRSRIHCNENPLSRRRSHARQANHPSQQCRQEALRGPRRRR
jgi:hypothetical protein